MSFLTIEKRAVTAEETEALLREIYAQPKSFGVYTKYYDPADIGERTVLSPDVFGSDPEYLRRIDAQNERAFGIAWDFVDFTIGMQDLEAQKGARQIYFGIMDDFNEPKKTFHGNVYLCHKAGFEAPADVYSANPVAYRAPRAALIKIMPENMSGADYVSCNLGVPWMVGVHVPGHNAQWHGRVILHEKAHASGAGEPQADMMSALIDKQAYENNNVTRVWGDYHAIGTLFSGVAKRQGILEQYGWPMVDANDYVSGLSQSKVDVMDEEQIKEKRFQKFDHLSESVLEVSRRLKQAAGMKAFRQRHFGILQKAAMDERNYKPFGREERQILRRLALASIRLPRGEAMYGEAEETIPEDLRASECEAPITFTPGEFIPE